MLVKEDDKKETKSVVANALPTDRNDPFVYFTNVIRGNIVMQQYDLSSSATNEIVVKILEAAKHAAKTGKTVVWNEFYKN